MSVAILKYDSCNVASLSNCLKLIDVKHFICNSAKDLKFASVIILPGVGTFEGVIEEIMTNSTYDVIKKKAKNGCKIIGICVGMQILADTGSELFTEKSKGLGLIAGHVQKMKNFHIGWNNLNSDSKVSKNLRKFCNKSYYFNHSNYIKLNDKKNMKMYSFYEGIKIPAVIINKNILGFQFHPEKSQGIGKKLLEFSIKRNL
jgi:glutamine amidotransferase